ncbi:MAG: hypothetical protein DRP35_10280, partial [Candidatus Zixiibacteriota bacterium]
IYMLKFTNVISLKNLSMVNKKRSGVKLLTFCNLKINILKNQIEILSFFTTQMRKMFLSY